MTTSASLSNSGSSATRLTASGDASLEDLIEECTNRLQRGEAVDIGELARLHPDQAERLRRILPSLQMMADIGRSAVREITGLAVPDDPTLGLGELGDFRILREVGRGGMGVVYEAEQISLNRRVALKVLPFAAAMDPTQLRRFQTEALAAAQLHHTHIVPVYSVGCERGVHYYAMQFIDGQTLAAVIAGAPANGRPGWPSSAAARHLLPAEEKVAEKPLRPAGEQWPKGRRPGEGGRDLRGGGSGDPRQTLRFHDSIVPQPRVLPPCRRAGHPGRRGPRLRPQGRHHPPRHQAGQLAS